MTKHKIPLGALVEVNADYLPEHGMRLFVGKYSRDCDGTPLYDLTHKPDMIGKNKEEFLQSYSIEGYPGAIPYGMGAWEGSFNTHWGEESLKIIKLPEKVNDKV